MKDDEFMKISIIGAGRVAYHLFQVLKDQHEIIQIFSRTGKFHGLTVDQNAPQIISDLNLLSSETELCMIAVSDQAISDIIVPIHRVLPDALIVHTSGSTHISRLTAVHQRAGVFYPLQTFSVERTVDWSSTPLFVEATDSGDLQRLTELAESLSQRVYAYTSEQRLSLHLAAVFACNFSNYCYDIAKQIVDARQVDFRLLYPLINETAQKAQQADPQLMQTGPAMRGDINILEMHQRMLNQSERKDLSDVYQLLSAQIKERHTAS